MSDLIVRNNKKTEIPSGRIGLFFEDINYGADGGIYCEMLENYNFEALMAWGDRDDYSTAYDGLYGWEPYPEEGEGAMLETLSDDGISKNNPHYLSFTASDNQRGFSNKAYDGIYLKKGEEYKVSCYIRRKLGYKGAIDAVIDLWGNEIQRINLSDEIKEVKDNEREKWEKCEVKFTAKENVNGGIFAVMLSEQGRAEFDFISLKPLNAVCGVFRRDLAELLKELNPGFLRFPGGCIVEGNTIENRYQWKHSVGPLEERKNNWNRWAVHGNSKENNYMGEYCHYNQTLGLGYYEYFLLCEYLNCQPLPVANVGLACQYQSTELVELGTDEFKEYIKDVLDLIEFANGDETTKWGAVRAGMGHREPFNLKMIGIGNEQWETDRVHFFERYDLFEKAIHEKYPDMLLIGSAGPDVTSEHYRDAWNFYMEKAYKLEKNIDKYVYAVDEHYYQRPEWMLENSGFYDKYPRDIKVFAGEYAAHVVPGAFNNPSSNTLYAALAEAAFMTGLERNADVVVLASYAPLFARIGYTQWSPDLIWFDGKMSYRTPSYYVQKMYSVYTGKYTVDMEAPEGLYKTASYNNENDSIYIKLVNVTGESKKINFRLEGFRDREEAVEIVLSGNSRDDFNSIEEPEKVAVKENKINLKEEYEVKPYSFVVIKA
ncbi:MAG: alpha-L-arabinofuranosidase C-terminal domain-containing protein [Lachnospiraceae bacterium]